MTTKMTIAEMKTVLTANHISFKSHARKADLEELMKQIPANETEVTNHENEAEKAEEEALDMLKNAVATSKKDESVADETVEVVTEEAPVADVKAEDIPEEVNLNIPVEEEVTAPVVVEEKEEKEMPVPTEPIVEEKPVVEAKHYELDKHDEFMCQKVIAEIAKRVAASSIDTILTSEGHAMISKVVFNSCIANGLHADYGKFSIQRYIAILDNILDNYVIEEDKGYTWRIRPEIMMQLYHKGQGMVYCISKKVSNPSEASYVSCKMYLLRDNVFYQIRKADGKEHLDKVSDVNDELCEGFVRNMYRIRTIGSYKSYQGMNTQQHCDK